MAAVTARVAAVPRETAARRSRRAAGASGRRGRFRARIRGAFRFAISVFVLAVVFGYVNVYANLTTTSYDKSQLMKQYRLEKIRNERLKVELIRLNSPRHVMAGARKAGMVPAAQFDDLNRPQTVASAKAN